MDGRGVNRRILKDAVAVGGLTMIVKLAGAAKVVVGARFFGASSALDAYLIAFLLPSFLADVLAGAIGPSLIPTLIEVRERDGPGAAEALYRDVLWRSLAALTLLAAAIVTLSGPLLHLLASGFAPESLRLTRSLLLWMIPILPLSAAGVTWRSILNAQDRFFVAALTPVLTPLASIVALVVYGRDAGIDALAFGTLAGATLEALVLAIAVRSTGWSILPRLRRTAHVSRVANQYAPLAASNLVMGGSTLVDQTMAAMLGPAASPR